MTATTPRFVSRRTRAQALAVLGAAALALFAAGPAAGKPSTTAGGGASCTLKSPAAGVTYSVPDGTVVTRTNAAGVKETWTCQNGSWLISSVVVAGPVTTLPVTTNPVASAQLARTR